MSRNYYEDRIGSRHRLGWFREPKRHALASKGIKTTPSKEPRTKHIHPDSDEIRKGIVEEYKAINMYEEIANSVSDPKVKEVFLDIAKEEKTHVGEFQALLLEKDKEQIKELKKGEKEVNDKTKSQNVYYIRDIKYNKKGNRVGGYTKVMANSEEEAIQKISQKDVYVERVPKGEVRSIFRKKEN